MAKTLVRRIKELKREKSAQNLKINKKVVEKKKNEPKKHFERIPFESDDCILLVGEGIAYIL